MVLFNLTKGGSMKLPFYLKAEPTVDGYTKKEKDRIDESSAHCIGYKISIRPIAFCIFRFLLLIKRAVGNG